jgi:hypothetical protein
VSQSILFNLEDGNQNILLTSFFVVRSQKIREAESQIAKTLTEIAKNKQMVQRKKVFFLSFFFFY